MVSAFVVPASLPSQRPLRERPRVATTIAELSFFPGYLLWPFGPLAACLAAAFCSANWILRVLDLLVKCIPSFS